LKGEKGFLGSVFEEGGRQLGKRGKESSLPAYEKKRRHPGCSGKKGKKAWIEAQHRVTMGKLGALKKGDKLGGKGEKKKYRGFTAEPAGKRRGKSLLSFLGFEKGRGFLGKCGPGIKRDLGNEKEGIGGKKKKV